MPSPRMGEYARKANLSRSGATAASQTTVALHPPGSERGYAYARPLFRLARSVLWLGAFFLMLPAAIVYAHGGGLPQLTNAEAGPYRVFAWTQPEPWRVGQVHLSIAVTLPPPAGAAIDEGVINNAPDTPVTDATVQVTLAPADDPDGSLTVQAAPQEQLGSLYYEADATLPAPGEWRVIIDVSGSEGNGSASFVTEALPTRSLNTLLIIGGLGLAALALAALAGVWRGRRTSEGVRNS